MSPSILQFVTSFVMPLVVAVVTAVLTVRLSFRQFQSERWWDRKADAYSRIVEALHHIVAYLSMNYNERVFGDSPSEMHKEKVEESYRKALIDLEVATGVGAYVISDEAAKTLAKLEEYAQGAGRVETLEDDIEVYGKVLAKIRDLAKKDLKVR